MGHGPLEKVIEAKVVAHARAVKYLAYKFTSPGRRSVPDRIFINPDGIHIYVEFKRAGEKSTPAQRREQERLADRGCLVFECSDIDWGKRLIDSCLDTVGLIKAMQVGSLAAELAMEEEGGSQIITH